MIFSKFFQPKYKHKDPLIRIQAIEALTASEPENKSVLHELAFNDGDSRVSVAALNKLNNFDLWWKMMEIAKDARLSKHARNKVENALLGDNDVEISDSARKSFIRECNNGSLLETLVQKNAVDISDTELFLAVLAKINKPQLSMRILLNTNNEALQEALFAQVSDEADLIRIAKKATNPSLLSDVNNKLAAIKEAREKPIQLEKDTKLVLSKLLALTEETVFEKFVTVKSALQEQFNLYQQQFAILDSAVSDSFQEKYQQIEQKLQRRSEQLKGDWDIQQELERTSAALNSAKEKCDSVLSSVSDALTNRVAEITSEDLQVFNQRIAEAEAELNQMLQSKLTEAEYRGIEKQVNKLLQSRSSLASLPALQDALQQAAELLNQFRELALPEDSSQIEAAQSYLDDIRSQWRELSRQFNSIWPATLENDWQARIKEWQAALSKLRKELNEATARVRGKFNAINRAVDLGRFKQAMRNYESAKKDFMALPDAQQNRLERQFDKVREQIENLKDWQEYIAAPKKPELLRELEQLVLNPIEPEAQAERVKELRKEWNSLGVVENDADEALNKAFNLACEEAFKPCREFYAEQEKQRDDNLKAKQSLLQELAGAAQDDMAELSKSLRHMQNKWKEIGAVDYKFLDTLNDQYQQVVTPIKDKVNAFHQDNTAQKKALLEKAKGLLEDEDWKAATDTAKKLQESWRKIGFAGHKQENSLWSEFRAVNDKVFARRQEAITAQQEQDNEQIAALTQELQQQADSIDEQASRAAIEAFVNVELKEKLDSLQQFPKRLSGDAIAFAVKLKKQLEEKLLYLGDSQRSEQYQAVFAVLENWRQDGVPAGADELPNYWRQAFATLNASEQGLASFDRHQLLLLMELLDNRASPEGEEQARKTMQLQLMTLKLQEGISLEMDELLRAWITIGKLSEQDIELLPRIKKIF